MLLPQGKFAELLHATGSARTKLLKGLFEVDLLETVRDRAATRSEALTQLVHEAELARARLRDDPAGAAETARSQAETATTMAERLSSALENSDVGKTNCAKPRPAGSRCGAQPSR